VSTARTQSPQPVRLLTGLSELSGGPGEFEEVSDRGPRRTHRVALGTRVQRMTVRVTKRGSAVAKSMGNGRETTEPWGSRPRGSALTTLSEVSYLTKPTPRVQTSSNSSSGTESRRRLWRPGLAVQITLFSRGLRAIATGSLRDVLTVMGYNRGIECDTPRTRMILSGC
jgi:hypothetical protein